MPNTKYSFETRGTTTVKVYSKEFSTAYHIALNNMLEGTEFENKKLLGSIVVLVKEDGEFELAQRLNLQDEVDSLQNLMRTSEIKGRMETH